MAAATKDIRPGTANAVTYVTSFKAVENMADSILVRAVTYDASKVTIDAAESVSVMDIPDDHMVLAVGAECITAEGATATVDVGDDAGATQYLSNFNANSAGGKSVSAATAWKVYTAANDIRITADHNLDACVVRVWAVMVPLV
jgi:hypothetical protein